MRRALLLALVALLIGNAFGAPVVSAESYTDLSHPVFTATTDLHAALVSPEPNSASATATAVVEVASGLGQGVELRINGELVPFTRIGRRTIDAQPGITRYTYYGVPLEPGPNELSFVALGADGLRGTPATATIYGPGKPATLEANFEGRAVADGKGPISLRISALDRWQHPAVAGSAVKVTLVSGDARFDFDRTKTPDVVASAPSDAGTATSTGALAKSFELLLEAGGTATVALRPGLSPGDVVVHLDGGDAALERRLYLAANARTPLVVGVAAVGVGAVPGAPGEEAGVADGANSRKARVALFATGTVAKKTLATVAYDTANTLGRNTTTGTFDADSDARPYLTYGDSSVRREDALSRDHLYARVDSGRSSLMWGEFQAQTGPQDGLGGFNALVDGAKLELAGERSKLVAFRARNDVAYARQIVSPSGLATFAGLLHGNIVVGSDNIDLVSLDRRTGAVVSETPLTRNIDYTLDYDTGRIHFIDVPLPYDANLNPQQLLVQYEYDGSGAHAQTTGGRFETLLGRKKQVRLGIGYVNDAYGSGNASLFGQDARGEFTGGTWSFSHLTSRGDLGNVASTTTAAPAGSGDAFRATFNALRGPNRVAFGLDATSPGFNNPFGGLTTPGLLNYRAEFARRIDNRRSELIVSYDHQQNAGSFATTSQSTGAVHVREAVGRNLTLTAGLVSTSHSGGAVAGFIPSIGPTPVPAVSSVDGTTTQSDLALEWKPSRALGLSVRRTQDIGGVADGSQPSQTLAQLDFELPGHGRAYLRELWSASPTVSFATSTQALTTPVLATHVTSIGFERPVGNALVTSDYSIQQTANGTDVTSSMGVKERFEISKRVRGDFFYQRANNAGSVAGGFNVYGLDVAYAEPNGRFRSNGSYQLRTGDGGGSSFTAGAAGSLSPAISLFGTANTVRGNGASSDDVKFGIAFRPATNDRGVTLFSYERKDGTTTALPVRTDVLSLEELYRPASGTEIAARAAYKLDGDAYYAARTQLYGLRITQRVGKRFDIGVEGSTLGALRIPGASASGVAVETGYRISDSMRAAIGYNISGAPDPALAAAPGHRGIYATMTSTIDRLFGWGKDSNTNAPRLPLR